MRIRDRIFRIGAGLLCVIMAALLIVLMFMNHRRNQERADELRRKTEERKVLETQKMEKAGLLGRCSDGRQGRCIPSFRA